MEVSSGSQGTMEVSSEPDAIRPAMKEEMVTEGSQRDRSGYQLKRKSGADGASIAEATSASTVINIVGKGGHSN